MQFVAGIDQSVRHTGVCVLDSTGKKHLLELIEPNGSLKGGDLLVFVRGELTRLLAPFEIATAVMEGYSYNSVNRKFDLGEIGGVVKLVVLDKKATLHIAAPKQLKKYVTGRATAEKKDVMDAIKAQHGEVITDDNKADAYGLARIALEILSPTSTYRHQIDVVKMITKQSLNSPKRRSKVKALRDSI
jgi:Holliday junction resolvasome RuvABC endonuclease subunit